MLQQPDFQSFSDRLPPQNIDAEEAILGSILLDPEALSRVMDFLRPEGFYITAHQDIYRAALALHNQGRPTDLMSMSAWLNDQGVLEKIGGQARLAQLVDRTISSVNVDQYASLVMEKYLRRKLIHAGNEISQLGYDGAMPLETILDQSEQKVFAITQDRPQPGLIPTSDILIDTFSEIESRSLGTAMSGLPCGFYDLDAMTQGFQRSDLIIAAGRPSMGKCCAADTEITLADGRVVTIQQVVEQQQADLLTLTPDWQFKLTQPSAFVDDGIKPVFRVTTRLGRWVETTLTHPYLTVQGWRSLAELQVGDRIAVPRQLPLFGSVQLLEANVKLLAYLIGDGCLTSRSPLFTNSNPTLQADFTEAVQQIPGLRVRVETSQGTRTPSLHVTGDLDFIQTQWQQFGEHLQAVLQTQQWTGRAIAERLHISPSLVTQWIHGRCVPNADTFTELCQLLDVPPETLAPYGLPAISKNGQNPLTVWLTELGIWGKDAHSKTIPAIVFQLTRSQLALFLNRLFATDGWATVLSSGQAQVGFASVSHTLVRQVQHLLLRFGIIAAVKSRSVKYNGDLRPAWQLDITDAIAIQTLIDTIGIFGKAAALDRVQTALSQKHYQTNRDLIPMAVWQQLTEAKGEESWRSLAARAGITATSNIHVGKRAPTRQRLLSLATALDKPELQNLATSQVYWDEIVAIESMGEKQVYDLTIPDTHNFVANDICVHNTSFVLNIARNIAAFHKLPIAIFSLEMSKEQLVYRLLSSEIALANKGDGIESNRLRSGRINQHEWERLGYAISALSQLGLYIDDTANISVSEIRSRCRRLQAESGKPLGLILLDYLQLMEGGGDNRVQELSKMTRSLKGLARELNVPIIALSQLSRGVESRTNKRPMMSDLRESGSIEQDADLIIMLYRDEYYNPDTPDRGIAEVIITKHRNGPVGTVKLLFKPEYTCFYNMAAPNR